MLRCFGPGYEESLPGVGADVLCWGHSVPDHTQLSADVALSRAWDVIGSGQYNRLVFATAPSFPCLSGGLLHDELRVHL